MQPTASTTGVRDTLQVAGKTVARMAFGAMRLADCRIWGPPTDSAHSIRLARRAVECGVEHIDAADTYGLGVVEDILREALHPYPEHLLIATKIGQVQPRPGEWVPVGNVAAATLRLTDRQVAMLTAAASANAFTASDN